MGEERKTIFLVDDNASNLSMGRDVLSGTYNAYTFNSGQTLFKALDKKKPDLILLDVEMPEMNGYEVIERLKSDKSTVDIPVIFLTAHESVEAEIRGFSLGAADYITKPFSAPRLLKRIEKHLDFIAMRNAEQQRLQVMLDASPMVCAIFDENGKILEANQAAATMFGRSDKRVYTERFFELSPEYQPDGILSREKVSQVMKLAFETGHTHFEWRHQTPEGEQIPCEVNLERVHLGEKDVVIAYVRDLREQREMLAMLEAANNALMYREKLLNATNKTAEVLLSISDEDTMQAFTEGMEIVGKCLDLDRVQLWLNDDIDGVRHFTLKYQWVSVFGKEKEDVPIGMSINRPAWLEMFMRGECVNGPVSSLSHDDKIFLNAYDIGSLVMMPMFSNKELIGFFGVDDCRNERTFSDDEIDMLASTGLMFTNAFNRMEQSRIRAEMEVERDAGRLRDVLLSGSPFIMNIWDESLSLVSTSQQSVEMFGLTSQEHYIEAFFQLSPERQSCGERSDEKAMKFLNQAIRQDAHMKFEWMHCTLSGEEVPAEITLSRFKRHGKYFVAAYTVDLRPVKEAMRREQELMERWTLINEATPIGVNFWDEELNYLDGNEMGYKMFGFTSTDEFGEKWRTTAPKLQPDGTPSLEKMANAFKATIEEGTHRCEWMHYTSDGSPLPLDINFARVKEKDGYMIVCFLQDLRQLRDADKKIREAEETNTAFLEAAPFAINVVDENFAPVDCNQQTLEIFGFSSKEDYWNNIIKLHPEFQPCGTRSAEKLTGYMQTVMKMGSARFEWMHLTLSGDELPMEIVMVRLERHGKHIIVTYSADLRPVKAAMEVERSREMSERIQLLFDYAPVAIGVYNEDLTFVNCNSEVMRLYGFNSKEECLREFDKRRLEFAPSVQPCGTKSDEMMQRAFEQAALDERVKLEWMILTTDSIEIPTEVTVLRLDYHDSAIFVTYISDLREARAAEERMRLIIDNMPLVTNIIGRDSIVTDCNEEGPRLFGFPDKQEYMKRFFELQPEFQPGGQSSREKALEMNDIALRTGQNRFEWMHKHINGEPIPCEVTLIRVSQQGESRLLSFVRDLREFNERKRAEIAEESNRAKSRFLARMSHEIRTPITAVAGISEIQLQNPELTPEIEESFAKINDSSSMLLGIVNDILDLSKIEAGKMSLLNEEYEVASLINDVIQPYFVYLGYKDMTFHLHVDENLPRFLIGDALRIKQIVNNILSNSFKYTDSGSVNMNVQRQENPSKKGFANLVISIKDTGFGMSPEQVSVLFKEEYVRFHEKETYVTGTGLGMTIVHSLAQMMNAHIEVESEVGVGTNVVISIPQGTTAPDVIGKDVADSLERFEMSMSSAGKKFSFVPESMPYGNVLVVDDVDANLYVARGLLAFYDLKVDTCDNGYKAIEKVQQGKVYDIVFMDHMMPGINGIETMSEMRGMGYSEPIVALTANALIGQAEAFIKNGFDGFISKPIKTAHLNAILIKHIRDKQPPEVLEAARAANANKPVSRTDIDNFQKNSDLINKLRLDFARNQKDVYANLSKALRDGDSENAYLLTHTLKGSAGLIGENALADAAANVEHSIREGQPPTGNQMNLLKTEIKSVLERIGKPQKPGLSVESVPKEKAMEVFNKLIPLLESSNTGCLGMIDELRTIPETAVIVRQMEEFDFRVAAKNLKVLRAVVEEG